MSIRKDDGFKKPASSRGLLSQEDIDTILPSPGTWFVVDGSRSMFVREAAYQLARTLEKRFPGKKFEGSGAGNLLRIRLVG